jgi:hypothetical protein
VHRDGFHADCHWGDWSSLRRGKPCQGSSARSHRRRHSDGCYVSELTELDLCERETLSGCSSHLLSFFVLYLRGVHKVCIVTAFMVIAIGAIGAHLGGASHAKGALRVLIGGGIAMGVTRVCWIAHCTACCVRRGWVGPGVESQTIGGRSGDSSTRLWVVAAAATQPMHCACLQGLTISFQSQPALLVAACLLLVSAAVAYCPVLLCHSRLANVGTASVRRLLLLLAPRSQGWPDSFEVRQTGRSKACSSWPTSAPD